MSNKLCMYESVLKRFASVLLLSLSDIYLQVRLLNLSWTMPVSFVEVATRAFVKVLLALARSYKLALQVKRDSSPDQLVKAYRKVLWKAHPDKGGWKAHVQELQDAVRFTFHWHTCRGTQDTKIPLRRDKSSISFKSIAKSPHPLFRFLACVCWSQGRGSSWPL